MKTVYKSFLVVLFSCQLLSYVYAQMPTSPQGTATSSTTASAPGTTTSAPSTAQPPFPNCTTECQSIGSINGFVISSVQPCTAPNFVHPTQPACCCFTPLYGCTGLVGVGQCGTCCHTLYPGNDPVSEYRREVCITGCLSASPG